MLRTVASKIAWLGRTASMVFGLALVMALVLGVATTALSATGANFILGKGNTATTPTSLVSTLADAAKSAFIVQNKSGGAALDLRVGNAATPADQVAPMKVNSNKVVTKLNADTVDGKSDTDFYSAGSKVADADTLDGNNSTSFMGSSTYTTEDWPPSFGAEKLDGTRVIQKSCDVGDRLLAGGPANIDAGTILLESFPANTTTWHARIQNVGALDAFNVVVLCANQ